MPELAEVEIARRALATWLVGQGAVRLTLRDPRLLKSGELGPPSPVASVRRRAKILVLERPGHSWIVHLRMTGRFSRHDGPGVRAVLSPQDGEPVYFADTRCLGELHGVHTRDQPAWFAARKLGPEPWPEQRPASWWQDQLGGLRTPVKVALLRQDRVAGLGNIAASEILWRAQVSPTRPARELDPQAWSRIGRETIAHLDHLLAVEDVEIAYVTQGGENPFLVYGRAGEPCPRCGAGIARTVQSGRSTFACPACQDR